MGLVLAALAIGEALLARRPGMVAPPGMIVAACVFALIATRHGAGFAVRGWAIAMNLLCALGLAALLAVAAVGFARGTIGSRAMLVAAVAAPLFALAIANVRASVGPRPWDDAPSG